MPFYPVDRIVLMLIFDDTEIIGDCRNFNVEMAEPRSYMERVGFAVVRKYMPNTSEITLTLNNPNFLNKNIYHNEKTFHIQAIYKNDIGKIFVSEYEKCILVATDSSKGYANSHFTNIFTFKAQGVKTSLEVK